MCNITVGQPEESRQAEQLTNNGINGLVFVEICVGFISFTSASLVYSEDFAGRHKAASLLSLLDH